MDFIQYIRDRNLVTDTVAGELRDQSMNERIPIGRFLLEADAITVRDLMRVLALQSETPELRFGEIAMREGLITTTQLEAALLRQRNARRHPVEIVRNRGILPGSTLDNVVVDYVRFLELRVAEEDDDTPKRLKLR